MPCVPERRWCNRIQRHCKVIYDLAIYNEQNLYNLAHCDGFSGTTPPSRKRQGGVNQKPQALQACILTTPEVQTPHGVVRGYWLEVSGPIPLSAPMHGRTKARPYGRPTQAMVLSTHTRSHRYATLQRGTSDGASSSCRRYDDDWSVGDAPVMVNPTLSIGDA